MTEQPPTPQQPPPGYYPYPVYLPPYNTYAILSLVFAALIFPPLGIYFGHKAKKQIAERGERGMELATAGYIVGWVLTALYVLSFAGVCAFIGIMTAIDSGSGY